MPVISQCPICNKTIKTKPYHRKKVKGLITCSRECRGTFISEVYKGDLNPNFKYKTILEKYFANRLHNISKRQECDLDVEYLVNLYKQQNGLCKYTGLVMKLTTESWGSKKQADPDVLSVDRVDSSKGYLKGNVVLCCVAFNKMKGVNSLKEINPMITALGLKSFGTCTIKIKRVRDGAEIPQRVNLGDGGFDVKACKVEDIGSQLKVYSGISIQPSEGWVILALPRSSIYKKQLMLSNSMGLIDNGYTGEVVAIFDKLKGFEPYEIGERFIQLMPFRVPMTEFIEVDELSPTQRGTGGFGSSNK